MEAEWCKSTLVLNSRHLSEHKLNGIFMLIRRRRIRSPLSDIETHVHKQPLSSPGCHPKYKCYQRLIANLLELSKNIWKWCAIL